MSDPVIQGWCPGALRPMMSGDGLVVRVRPRGGRLTPAEASGVARLARQYGNGLIDLSSRANVQLRGVTANSHGPLIEGLSALGLIDPTTEAESHRNIVVTPFWTEGDGVQTIVGTLMAALSAPGAPDTPGKFGYAVDCGPERVLTETPSDIRIERDRSGGLLLRPDGAATGARVTAETVAERAVALARWFLETGGAPEGRGRMAAHLARGAELPQAFLDAAPADTAAAPFAPGPVALGFLAAFEFGQMQAETLAALSTLGPLRITPWRMLLVEGVSTIPAMKGVITDPANPLLRVLACTGSPGCPQALIATRPLARRLSSTVAPGQILHVSGCTKGCALPAAAPLTLIGRADGTCDLIRNGSAMDRPTLTGLDPATFDLKSLSETLNAP